MAPVADTPVVAEAPPPEVGRVYYRHRFLTRLCHWINALCIGFLLASGLNILNAHPALYWGNYGADADVGRRWLEIGAMDKPDGRVMGTTRLGSLSVDTSGILGTNADADGEVQQQAFPRWVTFPADRDLATARRWHFFFAWLFIVSGLVYLIFGLFTRHLQNDVWPRLKELSPQNLWSDIANHAKLRFPRGEDDKHYHILQKIAYGGTVFVLLPLMILTGLSMSPGFNAALGGALPSLFGGRASARSIHFIVTNLTVAFIVVHVLMVVLAGPWNQMRSMITGRYDVGKERRP
ncbi:cytochrome b/b6 domain-containing protein [Sphingosinicellaceae bacterium]|nr:cytochrome b/b6 domain-containing protein [Sphingosinicellaceae bacterium]